jgi:hypothetical protein
VILGLEMRGALKALRLQHGSGNHRPEADMRADLLRGKTLAFVAIWLDLTGMRFRDGAKRVG